MRKRALILTTFGVGFVIVVIGLLLRKQEGPFARFVCAPVPGSVRVTAIQNNAWVFASEPTCYLAFTADSADVQAVVRQGQFQACQNWDGFPVPSGPLGWRAADQIGTNGNFYRRSHEPKTRNILPPIGNNRRWQEYLWVDATGTNAYFLLWGI